MKRTSKIAVIAAVLLLSAVVAWFFWWRDDPERLMRKYTPAMEWIRPHHHFSDSHGEWIDLPAEYAQLSAGGRVDAELKGDKLVVAFANARFKGANMWGYVISDRTLQQSDFIDGHFTDSLCVSINLDEYVVEKKLSDYCVKVHFSLD